MKILASLAGATALALAVPTLADPGGNKGNAGHSGPHAGGPEKRGGNDRGKGGEAAPRTEARQSPAATGGKEKGPPADMRGSPGRPVAAAGRNTMPGPDRGNGKDRAAERSPVRIDRSAPVIVKAKNVPADWRDWRKRERDAIVRIRDIRDVPIADRRFDRRIVDGRGLIAGCPPGLAKKYNGCMPPGQVASRHDDWIDWRYRDLYRSGYRWDDGYLYQLSGGRIANYIPLLGGALYAGNAYPVDYFDYPAPAYYGAYYGGRDDYLYRYADGGIFSVDPETQLIQAIVGLVTGNDWTVGQAMPAGYDVYNVPPPYRDRYVDSADSWYRYDDGYIYGVDPETQLITTAISLLS